MDNDRTNLTNFTGSLFIAGILRIRVKPAKI